jgi:DNA-binding MarR family transcriptional regulator
MSNNALSSRRGRSRTAVAATEDETRNRLPSIKARSDAGQALAELAWTVFDVYFRLKEPADQLTAPHGQSAPRYALLRDLALRGPTTVAQIAKARSTVRQAVQRLADALTADGLTEFVRNPAHQRSKLLRLTNRGWSVIQSIAEDEAVGFDALAQGFNPIDLRTASRVLKAFKERVVGHSNPGWQQPAGAPNPIAHSSHRRKTR